MTTVELLERWPKMVEGLPFGVGALDEIAFAYTLAMSKAKDHLAPDAETTAVTVKSVDTGRAVSEFMISVFSTRGSVTVVVPSNQMPVLIWRT
jgi:hypothetical protein